MSLTLTTYAISLDRLKQTVGSGDRATIDAIISANNHFLSRIDEIDDEAGFTCAEAIAELVNGDATKEDLGYLYGYALKAICDHIGKELPNIPAISDSSDWIDEIDAFLEANKTPLTLNDLVYGGSPVRIPSPADYPFIGIWPTSALQAGLEAFKSLDLADADEEVAGTITQMREWLETAVKTPGLSLIGFLS